MISLHTKNKDVSPTVLTLPASCTPVEEEGNLASKREAQLSWMREKGLDYLGDPLGRTESAPRRLSVTSMRLVRNPTEPPEPAGAKDQ